MKQLTILFLLQDSEILLAMKKRGFGKGRWNGVGGKVEQDETVAQAVVRETEEEINVTPANFEKVAEITFNETGFDNAPETMQVHVFECRSWHGEPTESEEMAPKWFPLSDIPYKDMWADDIHWLPLVLEGKKLICRFTLDDNDQVTEKTIEEVNTFPESN